MFRGNPGQRGNHWGGLWPLLTRGGSAGLRALNLYGVATLAEVQRLVAERVAKAKPAVVRIFVQSSPTSPPSIQFPPSERGFSVSGKLVV